MAVLAIVDGLGTSLDVAGNAVVVRGRVGGPVAEAVEGDSVLGCAETEGGGVSGDGSRGDVVGCLCTDEEAVTSDNRVSGERRALSIAV